MLAQPFKCQRYIACSLEIGTPAGDSSRPLAVRRNRHDHAPAGVEDAVSPTRTPTP